MAITEKYTDLLSEVHLTDDLMAETSEYHHARLWINF